MGQIFFFPQDVLLFSPPSSIFFHSPRCNHPGDWHTHRLTYPRVSVTGFSSGHRYASSFTPTDFEHSITAASASRTPYPPVGFAYLETSPSLSRYFPHCVIRSRLLDAARLSIQFVFYLVLDIPFFLSKKDRRFILGRFYHLNWKAPPPQYSFFSHVSPVLSGGGSP